MSYKRNELHLNGFIFAGDDNYSPVKLQSLIDSLSKEGGTIVLPSGTLTYDSTIEIPEGIRIVGSSKGDTMFGSGATKGTILNYTGSGSAIRIKGKFVTLENLYIKGTSSAENGIFIDAEDDGRESIDRLYENIFIKDVFIFGFSQGNGLKISQSKAGAIAYSGFENIRIRNCHTGIFIYSMAIPNSDGSITGFINSNWFNGVYISGGGFHYGIRVKTDYDGVTVNGIKVWRPANNLVFTNLVIEPPSSEMGHLYLEGSGTGVIIKDGRIEASQQDSINPSVPVIYLDENTAQNKLYLDQASITIQDNGKDNIIESKSLKTAFPSSSKENLYENTALLGLELNSDGYYEIPGWVMQEQLVGTNNDYPWRNIVDGCGVIVEYDDTIIPPLAGYKAIKVTLDPHHQFFIEQHLDDIDYNLSLVAVNAYVKANAPKDIQWIYKDENSGIITLGANLSSGSLEPIGGHITINRDLSSQSWYYKLQLFVQNPSDTIKEVWFLMPQLSRGEVLPKIPSKLLHDTGGIIYGNIGFNIGEINDFHDAGSGSLIIPNTFGVYKVKSLTNTIQRINYSENRFKRFSIITLLLEADITIANNVFIRLNKDFKGKQGQSLTLYTPDGNGTWVELSRSEPLLFGSISQDVSALGANYELTIPTENVETIILNNSSGAPLSINRINNIYANRFASGRIIAFKKSGTESIKLVNNPYLTLHGDYELLTDGLILLYSNGDGTWREISRTFNPLLRGRFIGSYNINLDTDVDSSTHEIILPTDGYSLFNIVSGTSFIQRINNASDRMFDGTRITFFNSTNTAVTIKNAGYIVTSSGNDYLLQPFTFIDLFTLGNGIWYLKDSV